MREIRETHYSLVRNAGAGDFLVWVFASLTTNSSVSAYSGATKWLTNKLYTLLLLFTIIAAFLAFADPR